MTKKLGARVTHGCSGVKEITSHLELITYIKQLNLCSDESNNNSKSVKKRPIDGFRSKSHVSPCTFLMFWRQILSSNPPPPPNLVFNFDKQAF